MNPVLIVLLVIIAVLIIGLVVLTILGKKAQKRQEEQQAQMEAMKQSISMLVIDKKRMKINEAGLPSAVLENTPKLLRRSKLPILKVKVGPQIMNLVCDEKIFDSVPVKKEVKADVSGIYVIGVKGIRGGVAHKEEKKGFWKDLISRAQEKAGAKPLK
ncbi:MULTISPECIES: hypothetical protein [unclassified Butyrivibrio]|uniref:hypothetical protein n=1 Tax=unclassified Butyrivibrio TaxID=2639466 RepID=UPI0003B36B23|nr:MULTISPECIES: hypothetical protein [unclassified Butyrivibrio]SDB64925.1 hypothetical protein SAMN02910263_03654 [Butyrivibrio sp. INlla16]